MTVQSTLRTPKAVLLVLFATLLTGCSSDELGEPLSRDYETYVGEFKSLGGIEVQDLITHLFETEDGEILYAYSERYDLDSEDYFGIEVEVYGVVSTYEELDKPLLDVKRITDAPDKDETNEEVTDVSYQDPDFGFSMTYPSNWTLSSTPSSVILEAPLPQATDEETEVDSQEAEDQSRDRILIEKLATALTKTSEDTQEDRATELRSAVSEKYTQLTDAQSELTYVGPDRLFSVRYKTDDGDIYYFVPRGTELFLISFDHQTNSDADRLDNGNVFASIVSGFRFTPYGESSGEVDETPVDEEEPEAPEDSAPTTEQVSFNSYRELESKPYQFKMSYPGNWYYAGSSTGYMFDDEAIEEGDTEAIITMTFNTTQTVGTSRGSDSVSITVEAAGRYYTLTGPAEYEEAMQTMAESITSTKEE